LDILSTAQISWNGAVRKGAEIEEKSVGKRDDTKLTAE
jgi:hypothetical protein